MIKEPMGHGSLANRSGNTLEKTVVGALTSKGFYLIPYSHYIKNPNVYGSELLITNYPYTSIYGHQGKTEFLLRSAHYQLEIRIECKWQQSSGSVDEKFPYLYLNCLYAMPEKDIFIIVGGGGYKPKALQWLKDACEMKLFNVGNQFNKSIQVMGLEEFLIWVNKKLP